MAGYARVLAIRVAVPADYTIWELYSPVESIMKLTVATRIIGGFSLIVVLLLINGGLTLDNLHAIEVRSRTASQLTLPALQNSNKLQAQLLSLEKNLLLAYFGEQPAVLDAAINEFDQASRAFDEDLASLNRLVADDQPLRAAVAEIGVAARAYKPLTARLFDARGQALALQSAIAGGFAQLDQAAFDAGTLLLEVGDLGLESTAPALESIISQAGNLENLVTSLVGATGDLLNSDELAGSREQARDLEFLVSELQNKHDFMQRQAEGIVERALLDEIARGIASTLAFVTGESSLVDNHLQLLVLAQQSRQWREQIEAQVEATSDLVVALLASAGDNARQKQQQILATVVGSNRQTYLVVAVLTLLAAGISWWTVRGITRPLNHVNRVLGVLASGDLTPRLEQRRNDEFTRLAANVNRLSASLREVIQAIAKRAAALAHISGSALEVTRQTTVEIGEQKRQIAEASRSTTAIKAQSAEVAEHASEMLDALRQTDGRAGAAVGIARGSKETVTTLAEAIRNAVGIIDRLHQSSEDIGAILDVVGDIAEQTNMLALNAAIEAARAGEQGRGFAVVADEVRGLAARTRESTESIQQMIEQIQSGALQAVEVMQASQRQAGNCVEGAVEVTDELSGISDAIGQVSHHSALISEVVASQNSAIGEIVERLQSLVELVEKTARGADNNAGSTDEVARLAGKLKGLVDEFKL